MLVLFCYFFLYKLVINALLFKGNNDFLLLLFFTRVDD